MSAYSDAAPHVSQIVNAATFAEDFPQPPEEEPEPDTPPIAAKARALYEMLRDYIHAGAGVPHRQIARDVGVPLRWVARFHRQIDRARALIA